MAVRRQVCNQFPKRFDPARIGGGLEHDGPVAAKHHTMGTEDGQSMLYIGTEVLDIPLLMIGLGH